jgi:hypothetical protein
VGADGFRSSVAFFGESVPLVSTTDKVVWYPFTTGIRDTTWQSVLADMCGTETVTRYRAHT